MPCEELVQAGKPCNDYLVIILRVVRFCHSMCRYLVVNRWLNNLLNFDELRMTIIDPQSI